MVGCYILPSLQDDFNTKESEEVNMMKSSFSFYKPCVLKDPLRLCVGVVEVFFDDFASYKTKTLNTFYRMVVGSLHEDEARCALVIKGILDARMNEDPEADLLRKKNAEARPVEGRKFRMNDKRLQFQVIGPRGVTSWYDETRINMYPSYRLKKIIKHLEDDVQTPLERATMKTLQRIYEETLFKEKAMKPNQGSKS